MFRRKRKVYKGSELLKFSDPNKFSEELKDVIKTYQDKGYEVEIHFHVTTSFCALIMYYEVKL